MPPTPCPNSLVCPVDSKRRDGDVHVGRRNGEATLWPEWFDSRMTGGRQRGRAGETHMQVVHCQVRLRAVRGGVVGILHIGMESRCNRV